MKFLTLSITMMAAFSLPAFSEESRFSIASYLEKCGGKIYSKCDSKDLNQETIFEAARENALKSDKDVMIVVGADWCPTCRMFSEMLTKDKSSDALYKKIVVVELNGDLSSTKDLAEKMGFSYRGYPQAFVINAESKEVSKMFYPSSFHSVKDLIAHLDLNATESDGLGEKPQKLGQVDVTTIEKPIELIDDYGTSKFYSKPKDLSEKYINQGIAALHVFHYVDAYRSFHQASKENPNSVMAHVGKVISVLQINTYEEGFYFVNQALRKIEKISRESSISKADLAWAEYAKSFSLHYAESYDQSSREGVKSIAEAFNNLFTADPENYEGQSLVAWNLASMIGLQKLKRFYQSVLVKDPKSAGAHHYLLHIAESENDLRTADHHAVILKDLASGSAHAQHMYGHTLPQRGRWQEALEQFQIAHNIHIQWAKDLGVDPQQDWHYSHNLDLMAATYLGLGDMEEARQTWEQAASFDSRAILHSLALAIVSLDYKAADQKLKIYENMSPAWKEYLKPLRSELELSPEKLRSTGVASSGHASKYGLMVEELQKSYLSGKQLSPEATDGIITYFAERFKAGGFDGWSNAYLELLRLKRVAKMLSMDSLLEDIQPLEFAVKSGSLCGFSEQKSFAVCRE